MSSKKIRIMVTAAFLVALDIIAARFLGFEIPTPMGPVQFNLQIIIALLCGYALGPLWGGLTLATSDLLGVMMNSGSLGMFPGFTLSAFLRGLLFGLLLHKHPIKRSKLVISVVIVFVVVDFFLNTIWLSIMMNTPFLPLLVSRIIPKLLSLGIQVVVSLFIPKLLVLIPTGD